MTLQQLNLQTQVRGYYIGTKTAVEALVGVPEGAIAYATDTNQFGTYDGATWTWFTPATSFDIHGLTAAAELLFSSTDEFAIAVDADGFVTEKILGSTVKATIFDYLSGLHKIVEDTTVANDFLVGDGTSWLKKTLSETQAILGIRTDGWQLVSEAWTRTGDYTFTVTGNVTAVYQKRTKVRYKDGGSYEYGVVLSSSYSAPNTTVTLVTNSDFAMASATITDRYISYADNPEGFPQWFNYTTTPSRSGGNYTNNPTINIARWHCVGGILDIIIRATMNATPGSSGYQTFTLPAPPVSTGVAVGMQVSDIYAMSAIFDAGSSQLRAWKYDGTQEAVASKIYHYTGSYQF